MALEKGEFGSHTALLVMLLLLIGQAGLKESLETNDLVFNVAFTGLLLACVYAVSRRRWIFLFALVLLVPGIGFQWASSYYTSSSVTFVNLALTGGLLGVTAVATLRNVISGESVTADMIMGSIVVYLLIGTLFMISYTALEYGSPGSFIQGGGPVMIEPNHNLAPDLIYYSFVTLTTLGFGDITPVSDIARLMTVGESLVGQLYIAILVASLVAKRISQTEASRVDRR